MTRNLQTKRASSGSNGSCRGVTLIEALLGLGLLTITLFFVLGFESSSFHLTRANQDKAYAIQKAILILNELKAFVASGMENQDRVLDSFDDGTDNIPVLTIDAQVTNPADPLSGNKKVSGGHWRFSRRITVSKLPNEGSTDVRYVTVRVFAHESSSDTHGRVLADVSSVIRTIGYHYPPTQVLDTYLIAIENVPGWWVYMATIQPLVENAISDLQARNPGLEYRTHWITSLSYGRDQEYLPYINEAQDSNAPIDHVYFYPGKMPDGSAVSSYYPPGRIRGRMNLDGEVVNGFEGDEESPRYNPHPYAMADQFNHSMRYYDELKLFSDRFAAGVEEMERPTLRLLMEQMYQRPERFQNVLLINLHGEMLPLPPLRNFSDAARDPANLNRTGIRAVTHPSQLRYENSDDLELRVYTYKTDPVAGPDILLNDPVSILLPGLQVTPTIQRISGGVDTVPDIFDVLDPYEISAAPTAPMLGTNEMYARVLQNPILGTVIELYNSPLTSPELPAVGGATGLNSSRRLYGMEYIPCPVAWPGQFLVDFSINLAAEDIDNAARPRNTARWIITISAAQLPADKHVTIETRLGTDSTTGTLYPTRNKPANLSRTYTWRGIDPPITERFQFLGDPRHCPYMDLHNNPNILPGAYRGYNPYFCAVDTAYWPWLNDTAPGWGTPDTDMNLDMDVPRFFQTIRDSNFFSGSLFTTMTGFSFYYLGLGGEIGYDHTNNFMGGIPTSLKPYDGSSGQDLAKEIQGRVNNPYNWGAKLVARTQSLPPWHSQPWLGELYPDREYTNHWADQGNAGAPRGNLPTGPGLYRRVLYKSLEAVFGASERFRYDSNKKLRNLGASSFFNSTGGGSGPFNHFYRNDTQASIQTAGEELEATFNLPLLSYMSAARPFALDANKDFPPEWNTAAYSEERAEMGILQTFYLHSETDKQSSSLLKLTDHTGQQASYYVMNGLSPTGYSGAVWLARYSMISMVEGFLYAGAPSQEHRVHQLPRVQIVRPREVDELRNPSFIEFIWETDWLRWDKELYTSDYPDGFAESDSITYRTLYSDDGGATWKLMQNNSIVKPGKRPRRGEGITGNELVWVVHSDTYPEGNYLIRIEAYRDDIYSHYSYHQKKIYIRR